ALRSVVEACLVELKNASVVVATKPGTVTPMFALALISARITSMLYVVSDGVVFASEPHPPASFEPNANQSVASWAMSRYERPYTPLRPTEARRDDALLSASALPQIAFSPVSSVGLKYVPIPLRAVAPDS